MGQNSEKDYLLAAARVEVQSWIDNLPEDPTDLFTTQERVEAAERMWAEHEKRRPAATGLPACTQSPGRRGSCRGEFIP